MSDYDHKDEPRPEDDTLADEEVGHSVVCGRG